MKNSLAHLVLIIILAASAPLPAIAQDVVTSNLITESKERVLRIEGVIPAALREVWKAFSTEAGLKRWVAPVVALDLRIGGALLTHYDQKAAIGSPGTIRLGIVNYLEPELITYKVTLNDSFSQKARAEDKNLQEIVQIVPWTNGTTKVISSMVGWGQGKEWDETYNFFAKGNAWTYQELIKSFAREKK